MTRNLAIKTFFFFFKI